jgi:hypothetical protein
MRDRLIGMVGTLGLALTVMAILPIGLAQASWPSNPNPGCDGSCVGATASASSCVSNALDPCTGTRCACDYENPTGEKGKCHCRVPVPASP